MLTDDDIRDALEAEFLGEPGNRNLADDLRVARAAIAALREKAAPAVPMSESQRADMICAVAAICTGTSSRTVAATAIEWVERHYGITTPATPSQEPAPFAPDWSGYRQGLEDGVQSAADLLKRMAVELVTDRGEIDPDTGGVQFMSAATREWHASLCELADEIERLNPATPAAAPSQEPVKKEQVTKQNESKVMKEAHRIAKGQSEFFDRMMASCSNSQPVTLTELLRQGFAVLMAKAYSEEWFDDLSSIDGLYEFLVAEGERIPDDTTIGGTIEAIIAALREKEGK